MPERLFIKCPGPTARHKHGSRRFDGRCMKGKAYVPPYYIRESSWRGTWNEFHPGFWIACPRCKGENHVRAPKKALEALRA